jgi:hypothetical protein
MNSEWTENRQHLIGGTQRLTSAGNVPPQRTIRRTSSTALAVFVWFSSHFIQHHLDNTIRLAGCRYPQRRRQAPTQKPAMPPQELRPDLRKFAKIVSRKLIQRCDPARREGSPQQLSC